ncbi:hypothetical protein LWM68_32625 [Niabella sp. W65]|nr:hypothetical protein [Niabella sp. W65]MCH7367090.1 hypothetical protein [Niabella sp. W65]
MTDKNIKGLATAAIHACETPLPEHAHIMPVLLLLRLHLIVQRRGWLVFQVRKKAIPIRDLETQQQMQRQKSLPTWKLLE